MQRSNTSATADPGADQLVIHGRVIRKGIRDIQMPSTFW